MIQNFICPDGGLMNKELCLSGRCRMQDRCAPMAFLAMAASEREWKGKPSTTQLLKGTREAYLEIVRPYNIDPRDRAYAVLGTKSHAGLEKYEEAVKKFSFVEEKLEIAGISGVLDNLEEQPNGDYWLVDYKTSGSYKIMKCLGIYKKDVPVLDDAGNEIRYKSGKKKGEVKTRKEIARDPQSADFGDWALQLNLYRIAAMDAGIPVQRLKIFAIVRDGGTVAAFQRGVDQTTYYFDVPVLPRAAVLTYFEQKRDALVTAMEEQIVPAICNSDESWDGRKCAKYCSVADACQAQGDNQWLVA